MDSFVPPTTGSAQEENKDILYLTGQYLSKTITPGDAKLLAEMVRRDPGAKETLLANVALDFLLQEKYQQAQVEFRYLFDLAIKTMNSNAVFKSSSSNYMDDIDFQPRITRAIQIPAPPQETFWTRSARILFGRPETKSHKTFRFSHAKIISIVLLFLAVTVGLWWSCFMPTRKAPTETVLATVQEVIDPVWEKGRLSWRKGQGVGAAEIALRRGIMQLELKDGTSLVLQGPVRFTLGDKQAPFCSFGKMAATVAPVSAGIFRVETPQGTVRDLGTEFLIDVDKDLFTEVTQGKVELSSVTGEKLPLAMGQAATIDSDSKIRFENRRTSEFIFGERFKEEQIRYNNEQLTLQKENDARINSQKDLLVHFSFLEGNGNRVTNAALNGRDKVPDLELINHEWGVGPYLGTTASAFTGSGARGEFILPDKYRQLTLEATVRLDTFQNNVNVLLMSNDFYERTGGLAWQITKDGTLQLFVSSVKSGTKEMNPIAFTAKNAVTRFMKGVWIKVSATIDLENGQVMQSVDGREIARWDWSSSMSITPGRLILGNSSNRQSTKSAGSLNGAVSDLKIFTSSGSR